MKQKFINPGATATIIFEKDKQILFIRRGDSPYKGMLALPGGFLNYREETLERAAQREAKEEVGLRVKQEDLVLLCVNSHPRRDPRDHIIDHVYVATDFTGNPRADDDAASYEWIPFDKIPKRLAFDHTKNIELYREWRLNHPSSY
jgi:8-oxo-dGTP diphosphatase